MFSHAAKWWPLVDNTQVSNTQCEIRTHNRYQEQPTTTMTSDELLQLQHRGWVRVVYSMIRNIRAIFKMQDCQRRWYVISVRSVLEKKCCGSTPKCGTAAARHRLLWYHCGHRWLGTNQSLNHWFAHILYFQSNLRDCFLHLDLIYLPFAWLHKCAFMFPLMTSSITDQHLLIFQFCRLAMQMRRGTANTTRTATSTLYPAQGHVCQICVISFHRFIHHFREMCLG